MSETEPIKPKDTRQRALLRKKHGKSIFVAPTSTANAFDLDGDGKLDAIEQVMMKYDADGDGTFSNAEIYAIIQEQLKQERKKGKMKHAIVGLTCFVFVLALGSFGTSFAAMFLSKELAADGDESVMRLQSNGHLASVQTTGETFDITPLTSEEYTARKLLVLAELEEDPHSHSHRRLKKRGCKDNSLDCDGDVLFDNGRISEKDFRVIEDKCKQQKNVKIRRTAAFDKQSDCICSQGTSVVVKTKKGPRKSTGGNVVVVGKGNNKNKFKDEVEYTEVVTGKGKPKKKVVVVEKEPRDREVIIVAPDKRKMAIDCVGEDCYISGDILLGKYGDSCDRNRNDCESHLICESRGGASQYGTCIYPRHVSVRSGGVCDLSYGDQACASGEYCYSETTVSSGRGYIRKRDRDLAVISGPSGVIATSNYGATGGGYGDDASRARSAAPRMSGVGECLPLVGPGGICNSPYACVSGYSCLGAGGLAVGSSASAGISGVIAGPSGVIEYGNYGAVSTGICS